jgi:hypothetical protein
MQQPLVGQGLLTVEASRSHSDTPLCYSSLSLYATVLFSYRVVPATLFCSILTNNIVKDKIPVLFTVARLCFTFRVN